MQPTDPTPGGAATDREVDPVLQALFRIIHRVKQTAHADPVERALIFILVRLKEQGPMRLSDVAADLGLDVSTMSRHVRTLETRGFLTRTADPSDGRAVRLALADPGREVLAQAWSNRRVWLERSLADWTVEDRRLLSDMLERFADALAAGSPERTS